MGAKNPELTFLVVNFANEILLQTLTNYSMKKIIFTFILLLLPAIILADDSTHSVVMVGDSGHGHNRNEVALPTVTYSSDTNTLTVEFESEESFVLEIEDVNGVTWYSGPLNTSGVPIDYYVNLQPNSTYIITISSPNDLFYGILEL